MNDKDKSEEIKIKEKEITHKVLDSLFDVTIINSNLYNNIDHINMNKIIIESSIYYTARVIESSAKNLEDKKEIPNFLNKVQSTFNEYIQKLLENYSGDNNV